MKKIAVASAILFALSATTIDVEAKTKKSAKREYTSEEKSKIYKQAWDLCKKRYGHVLHVIVKFETKRVQCWKY